MTRRSYNQYCGLAKSLDVVGERWTMLIVRNLLLGPLRYSELLRGLPGITTNLLAKRLQEMEQFGLIERARDTPTGAAQSYRLTPLGADLEPVVHALGRWAWSWMDAPSSREQRSLEWLLVALRRRYKGGESLRAELVADDVPYRFVLTEDRAEITRGELASPDVRIRGAEPAAMKLFIEGVPRGKQPAGLEVDGAATTLRSLVDAFERTG